jgi:hypothetical protein
VTRPLHSFGWFFVEQHCGGGFAAPVNDPAAEGAFHSGRTLLMPELARFF